MKKPSASVTLYRQFALKHYLTRFENARPLDEKANWQEKERWERDRDTVFRLAKLYRNAGFAWWVPVLVALALCLLFLLWLIWSQPKSYVYAAPENTYRVIEQVSAYEFVMQRVENGHPQAPELKRFCTDYRPMFQAGMTLVWFAYDDEGSCISVRAKDRGYVIDRGSDHWPKLAANCRNLGIGKPVVCDGGKPIFQ